MARRLTNEEINKEVEQMSNVMNWPYLYLPVMNLHRDFNPVGVILHTTKHPYDVFEINMFRMGEVVRELEAGKEPTCPVHNYDSFEAVVADGWVGD